MKKIKEIFIGLAALIVFAAAVFAEDQVLLIPLTVKMQTERILEHPGVHSVSLLGDGKYILSYSYSPDNRKILWEAVTGRKIFEVKNRDINYDTDSMRFLTYGNGNPEIEVYDLKTGNKIRTVRGSGPKGFGYTYFAHKGKYVCGAAEKTRYIWDLDTGKVVLSETGINESPWFSIYADDKEKVNVVISYSKDSDEIKLWDMNDWSKIGTYKGHAGGIFTATLSKDRKFLYSSGEKDGKTILWDVKDQSIVHTFGGHTGRLSGYLHEEQKIFITTGLDDKKIIFWNPQTGDKIFTLSCQKATPQYSWIGKSSYLAANCVREQAEIDIYNGRTGEKVRRLEGHSSPVVLFGRYSKTESPRFLSSSFNELIFWDMKNYRQISLQKPSGNYKAQFYGFVIPPDYNKYASYMGNNEISVWDMETGGKIGNYSGHVDGGENRYNYDDIFFSPNGKLMFLKQKKEKTITVLDMATGRKLEVIKGVGDDPNVSFAQKADIAVISREEKDRVRIIRLIAPQTLVDEQYYAVDKEIAVLQLERDVKIKELASPRGEFETTAEYEARLKSADAGKIRITNEYQRKIEAVLAQAQKRIYPYSARITLGRYDADRGSFEADFLGRKMLFPVPRAKAIELARHRDRVRVEGMLRYSSTDYAELVNAYLVDETNQEKYAFGRHTGDTAVAATQRVLPDLAIKAITLVEPSGNGILDAGEMGKIVVKAVNNGKGTAFGVGLVISATGGKGLRFAEKTVIGALSPQEEKEVAVDIAASEEEAVSADISLKVVLAESSDFDSPPVILSFKTKEYLPPLLQVAKIDIEDAEGGRKIGRGREVTLTLTVQNAGTGPARAVAAEIEVGSKDIRLFSAGKVYLETIAPGEAKKARFAIAVTQKYKGAKVLPLAFKVAEEHEKYSVRPDIKLALGEEAPAVKVVKVETRETVLAPSAAEDVRLAPALQAQQKTFGADDVAVVIGIERYQSLPKTDFSYNDAKLVREYLRAMGFAERNIEYLVDDRATLSAIKKVLETRLPNIVKPGSRVVIYYSGHGSPDAATGEAYIVPFDGDPQYLADTAYPLRRLYERLGRLPAKEILVVTDACFSGTGGRTVLAKGARPIVMVDEAKKQPVPDNVIVLSATQGAQISTFFPEKEQGLFTYYFLKALKDGKKDVYSVYQYVRPLVEDEAKRLNVSQSPTLSPDSGKIKGRFILNR